MSNATMRQKDMSYATTCEKNTCHMSPRVRRICHMSPRVRRTYVICHHVSWRTHRLYPRNQTLVKEDARFLFSDTCINCDEAKRHKAAMEASSTQDNQANRKKDSCFQILRSKQLAIPSLLTEHTTLRYHLFTKNWRYINIWQKYMEEIQSFY